MTAREYFPADAAALPDHGRLPRETPENVQRVKKGYEGRLVNGGDGADGAGAGAGEGSREVGALLATVMPGHLVAFPAVRGKMLTQVFGVDVGFGAAADGAGNGMDAIDAGNGMMHKEYSFYDDTDER